MVLSRCLIVCTRASTSAEFDWESLRSGLGGSGTLRADRFTVVLGVLSKGEGGFLRNMDTSRRSLAGVDSPMGSIAMTRETRDGLGSGSEGGAKRVLWTRPLRIENKEARAADYYLGTDVWGCTLRFLRPKRPANAGSSSRSWLLSRYFLILVCSSSLVPRSSR